jgi:acylglycerol lipase
LNEETLSGRGGVRVFVRSWRPVTPRAVVVICHGVNSHSGQYLWAGEQLQAAGYAVFALDLRGRGRSEGERLYIDHVSDYTSDLAGLIALANPASRDCPCSCSGTARAG